MTNRPASHLHKGNQRKNKKKNKYPVRWTAQNALHFPPLADLFIPTPTRLLLEEEEEGEEEEEKEEEEGKKVKVWFYIAQYPQCSA